METKELKIVTYIKKYGFEKAVIDFKLKFKDYPTKVLLKYDMINSDFSREETIECRGLVLEKNSWEIISYPFKKFFNFGEGFAEKIDLSTAKCLIKEDGTFIHLHHDWNSNEWFSGTSGMAEGEGNVNYSGITFSELFWGVANLDKSKLDKNLIYMFELCTPQNIVVTPHVKSKVVLIGVRKRDSLKELNYDELKVLSEILSIELVGSIPISINSLEELKLNFLTMPFSEEGYVVIDSEFRRVKMKNPAYLAVHSLKGKTAEYNILEIVKTNEIEEFGATFPERKEELFKLKKNYDLLTKTLNETWFELKSLIPKDMNKEGKKEYAYNVFEITKRKSLEQFGGLFFGLMIGRYSTVEEYLINYDNKKLYNLFR